jgi:hypothetical protein
MCLPKNLQVLVLTKVPGANNVPCIHLHVSFQSRFVHSFIANYLEKQVLYSFFILRKITNHEKNNKKTNKHRLSPEVFNKKQAERTSQNL